MIVEILLCNESVIYAELSRTTFDFILNDNPSLKRIMLKKDDDISLVLTNNITMLNVFAEKPEYIADHHICKEVPKSEWIAELNAIWKS